MTTEISNEREATEMEEAAFLEFEEKLKVAKQYAFVRPKDPLERPTAIQRSHHVRWSISLAQQACQSVGQQLEHAEDVRRGL